MNVLKIEVRGTLNMFRHTFLFYVDLAQIQQGSKSRPLHFSHTGPEGTLQRGHTRSEIERYQSML